MKNARVEKAGLADVDDALGGGKGGSARSDMPYGWGEGRSRAKAGEGRQESVYKD